MTTADEASGPAVALAGVTVLYGPDPARAVARLAGLSADASVEVVRAATGHTPALRDVTLSVPPGSLFAVMGLSGSGKSTLLRVINRLVVPAAGRVTVGAVDVTALDAAGLRRFRRTTAAMVFQSFGLLPRRSCLDNVAFPLRIQGQAPGPAREQARVWLGRVGLGAVADHGIEALSAGMRQRVGLARALVAGAPLLLMDEPFGALDPVTRLAVQDELRALQRDLRKTVVLVTHDPREAFRLSDRIAVLRAGRIVQTGAPAELKARPADAHVAALLEAAGGA
jgi:glycine betaine/proline transport system ATP-binding protein